MFFQTLDGIHYYGSAAVMDLVIMAMISKQKSALSVNLQLMCVVSIALNAIGWSMYHFYMPPDLYNAAYTLFYLFCAYILFRDLKVENARDRQLDSGSNDFPASIDEGDSLVQAIKAELEYKRHFLQHYVKPDGWWGDCGDDDLDG